MAPLAALAMAALLLTISVERPAEGVTHRSVAGLREAMRLLPPLQRAARELARAPSPEAMPLVAWLRPAPSSGLDRSGEVDAPVWSRPRDALIDLPPPA